MAQIFDGDIGEIFYGTCDQTLSRRTTEIIRMKQIFFPYSLNVKVVLWNIVFYIIWNARDDNIMKYMYW